MMNESWIFLLFMAFTLGIRHGFDLDHLAVIDGITRTVREPHYLSKLAGCLFSLGHGIVVTVVSLIIGSGLIQSHFPEWLDHLGAWISITFLFLFGALNLWSVFRDSSPSKMSAGIQSFLMSKLNYKKITPGWILGIGALFAFSFDTFTQIALFSVSASLLAGWMFSGILGFVFMVGMMVTDGLNGFFVSHILQRADRASMIISRSLGVIISSFSIVVGVISLFKIFGIPLFK